MYWCTLIGVYESLQRFRKYHNGVIVHKYHQLRIVPAGFWYYF